MLVMLLSKLETEEFGYKNDATHLLVVLLS